MFQRQPATFSLPTLPSPRRQSSDPECLGHPPPPQNMPYPSLVCSPGVDSGTSLPHREIPAPTKFQIPWPYRAPFFLTFDGLPSVGGRTSPPSERQWEEAPLSHHPSPLGLVPGTHRLLTQRERAAGTLGEGWTLGLTVTHGGVMVLLNPFSTEMPHQSKSLPLAEPPFPHLLTEEAGPGNSEVPDRCTFSKIPLFQPLLNFLRAKEGNCDTTGLSSAFPV